MAYPAGHHWNSSGYRGSVSAFKTTLMRVDEPAHAIREQHIHFLWLNYRGYFTFAKRGMRQSLSLAIGSSPIIRRAGPGGRTTRCAGAIDDS